MASAADLLILLLTIKPGTGLKTWIQNTGINNPLNWDLGNVPQTCDRIFFPLKSDIATYWNVKDITISGLSLPRTGEILLPDNIALGFRDEAECPRGKEIKYTRYDVKGWLDGDNWKTEGSDKWVPHSERVPCVGEEIRFPSNDTIAVQLPSILLPMKDISFGDKIFRNYEWNRFLTSELGSKLFKGVEQYRGYFWRTDIGCFDKKKCTCNRGAYTIRNGVYKEVNPQIFNEAVCLYSMPKCPPVRCYSPVVPEGHCCGICGAIIKLEDTTEDGYDLNNIKLRVKFQLLQNGYKNKLQTYIGRTNDGNVQIVIIAENSDYTIDSHNLANAITKNLTDYIFQSRLISHLSGLSFSNYLFNSISGIVFGTLISVLFIFAVLFYLYVIFPNKKLNLTGNKPFVFARFDNTLSEDSSEENLEVGIEPDEESHLNIENPIQAFDNPIYSESITTNVDISKSFDKQNDKKLPSSSGDKGLEKVGTQEYHNLVYDDLQRVQNIGAFEESQEGNIEKESENFSEIEL